MFQGTLAAVNAHENWLFFGVDRNRGLRLAIWPPETADQHFSKGNRVNTMWKFEPCPFSLSQFVRKIAA